MSAAVMASSEAQAFDASGFAGGLIGGMIGGAMGRQVQPRPVILYRNRPIYRVVPRRVMADRHYAASQPKRAAPTATNSAVVDQAADPFATAKPTQPAPIPVANKP